MLSAGVLTALLVIAVIGLDEGEVVRLITHDEAGQPRDTELWIADLPNGSYIRAGSADVRWLARLRNDNEAMLERNGESVKVEITVANDPGTLEAVTRSMAEKYGMADRIFDLVRSPDPVVIRLDSLGAVTATAHRVPHGVERHAQDQP